MSDPDFLSIPNPELTVRSGERAPWNTPDTRRWGYHNLHRIARHGLHLRSRNVLVLDKAIDMRIEAMPAVAQLTTSTFFSAMTVVKGNTVLFERYAPDFGTNRPHAMMSISKTFMHLIYGELVANDQVDLNATVDTYLPEIGSGYAKASVRDVLDMNVRNDYTEDYEDPHTSALQQELSMGWRVPGPGEDEVSTREFLCTIKSDSLENPHATIEYKSANTEVLGWIAERVTGRSLRDFLVEITEAAGLENALHVSTDRDGFPNLNGGCSLTARDLARYGLLFTRRGVGIDGQRVGNEAFLMTTIESASKHRPAPRDWQNYGAQLIVVDRCVGHGGFAGQFLMANLDTGVSVAFFSVVETLSGSDEDYISAISRMAYEVTLLDFD
ncbi:MAG: serine hydrolase [Thiotrichales bacterium]|nr:serine hydrolase [Thiotrichales bacterium]|tara:strand:- start:81 stop:1232 length:1152 start_codon:yes stop_codon:yes gene_type:complete